MRNCSGQCLCGKVTFKAKLKNGIGACHCSTCRTWSGGLFMSVNADGDVDIQGAENIGIFRSSEWAERAFCKNCGANLYYHLLPNEHAPNGEYILAAGSLDSHEGLVFDHEVYIDHSPGWYKLEGNETRNRMTEADVLALYGFG